MEIAWLAGLWEGEGSFFLHRSRPTGARRDYFYSRAVINMTDRDVMERCASLLNTKVAVISPPTKYPTRLLQYRVLCTGPGALSLMRTIRPHMGARRRAKIDELLAFEDARPDANEQRRIACRETAAGRARTPSGRLA